MRFSINAFTLSSLLNLEFFERKLGKIFTGGRNDLLFLLTGTHSMLDCRTDSMRPSELQYNLTSPHSKTSTI